MRTTITLDSDVEALLKKVMRERGLSFKEAVNTSLRVGLAPKVRADVTFPVYDLGVASVDTVHAGQLAAALEDDEITREMSTGR